MQPTILPQTNRSGTLPIRRVSCTTRPVFSGDRIEILGHSLHKSEPRRYVDLLTTSNVFTDPVSQAARRSMFSLSRTRSVDKAAAWAASPGTSQASIDPGIVAETC